MTIHREGYKILAITTLIMLSINALAIFALPGSPRTHALVGVGSAVFFLLVLQFFRVPHRTSPVDARHVLAPADGKVVVIEEVQETEYFNAPRRQVSIFMSPLNVHVSFNPVAGVVQYVKYHAGKYLVAWHPKSSTENERTTVVVQARNGVDILFRQIAGAMAKRIVWYVREGQAVQQGTEFGFIKFGSRIDLYLPLDATIQVQLNQKTVGGVTVIAELAP